MQQPNYYYTVPVGEITQHGGYHPTVIGTSSHGHLHAGYTTDARGYVVGAPAPAAAAVPAPATAAPAPVLNGSYPAPVVYGSYLAAPSPLPRQVISTAPPTASFAPVYSSYAPYGSYVQPYGSYYGNAGQRELPSQSSGPEINRGYFYDDYIHDKHSPRRSYAGFRPAGAPVYDGDIIYRKTISREDDFVLPRRSPHPSGGNATTAPAERAAPYVPAARSSGPATIEVVEAKDLPTSILDKTDPFVVIKVGTQKFQTNPKKDAGRAARWNEIFTVDGGLRNGSEGTIEVWDKDIFTKNDAIGSTTFYIENGDRWFALKPKGQVRLNITNCY